LAMNFTTDTSAQIWVSYKTSNIRCSIQIASLSTVIEILAIGLKANSVITF
jgi:hypothetical protein